MPHPMAGRCVEKASPEVRKRMPVREVAWYIAGARYGDRGGSQDGAINRVRVKVGIVAIAEARARGESFQPRRCRVGLRESRP